MNRLTEDLFDNKENKIPKHVAVICDGNGKWIKSKGFHSDSIHNVGIKLIEDIINNCFDLGVKALTFYVFSSENWIHASDEMLILMELFEEFFIKLRKDFKNNISVKCVGITDNLSPKLLDEIKITEEATEGNCGMSLNFALDYGSRLEITNSVKNVVSDINTLIIESDEINEKSISNYIFTFGLPDIDLIIRTNEEKNKSNFLLWLSKKSELWTTKDFWPNFIENSYEQEINFYNRVEA